MKKRLAIGALAAVLATAMLGASGAAAAVEFGDTCAAENAAPGEYTLTALSSIGPLPLTAPSSGVVTQVKVNANTPIPFSVPTTIKVLHPVGGNVFSVSSQNSITIAARGTTVGAVRLPVLTGDRLGLHGEMFSPEGSPISISLYCNGGGILGAVPGDVPPGTSAEFTAVTEGRVPLVGVLEADADGDGYGDETQDKCPQSAAVQTECPVVKVDTYSLIGNSSVRVLVATNSAAPVKVTGSAKLGKSGKAKLGSGPKTVQPGTLVSFKLKFSQKLKEKLKELDRGQKLALKIVASATNVAGQVSTDEATVKLKGQG